MELKPYDAARFVNRESEIALVEGFVRQLAAGEHSHTKTVVFRGERGAGKTWLCLHLKRHVLKHYAARVLLFSLFPPPSAYAQDAAPDEWFAPRTIVRPETIVTEIAGWMARELGATTAADATLAELGYWLTRDVQKLLEDRPLVLMVDSAYEADWDVLKLLETSILGPLAALPNTLLVITGRGRPYLWSSPALRIDAIDRPLEAFSLERVREQLQRMGYDDPARAEEILALGGGHPLNTFLLLEGYGQRDKLNQVILELLVALPLEERKPVRMALEALCVLDGFVEDDIAPMLAVRSGDPAIEQWPMQKIREERDRLVRTQMVQWQQGRFVVDESVRITVDNYLRSEAEGGLWAKLQRRAQQIYQERAARFPKYAEHFLRRADYHCHALRAANMAAECSDTPQTEQAA